MIQVISDILGEGASSSTIEMIAGVAVCLTLGLLARAICKIFEI